MSGEKGGFESFEELYKEHYGMVYRYVHRMVRYNVSAAEDLTQEVFFVAYQKWEKVRKHENVPGFLMVVAQNKIKKWYEKQNRVYMSGEEELNLFAELWDNKETVDAYSMVDLYSSLEHMLSSDELDILRHYYEYGYTSSEMAQKLGITESCFKVRVSRMKAKLKGCLTLLALLGSFWLWKSGV